MLRTALFILTVCLCASCKSPLASFSWIEGEWTMARANGGERLEVWKKADNTLFNGKGLKITGRDTSLLELIALRSNGASIHYIATVPNQNNGVPIAFTMISHLDRTAIFENAAHDFPQRIIYRYVPRLDEKNDADSIYVKVESLDGQGIDYAFRRK
jgi:hypothetical protein